MARRRFSQPPEIEPKVFTSPEEIESGIQQLRLRLKDLDKINPETVGYDDQLVHNIESNIRTSILEIFGANSPEYQEHQFHEVWHGPRIAESPFEDLTDYNQQCFADGIPRSKTMLDGLICRLKEKRETIPLPRNVHTSMPTDVPVWDIFICHAGEDKGEIARPLAEALSQEGLRVWYAEFALTLGDNLRRKIDNGLAQSRYGAVILSPYFFEKEWPQRELDGLTAREVQGRKVILPIWHKVTSQFIAGFSPPLADKLGISTDKGIPEVVQAVLTVVRQEGELQGSGDRSQRAIGQDLSDERDSVLDSMPRLLSEMRDDLNNPQAEFVREFFVLPNRNTSIGFHSKERFSYFEEEHPNLRGQVDILVEHGYVADVTPAGKKTRIYRMTEKLVNHLRAK